VSTRLAADLTCPRCRRRGLVHVVESGRFDMCQTVGLVRGPFLVVAKDSEIEPQSGKCFVQVRIHGWRLATAEERLHCTDWEGTGT
jgi:hypothetical protein